MKSKIHFHEFALLMALLMSIVSFSIDAVLPALGEIGKVFTLQNSNQAQWVIITIFSGMTLGSWLQAHFRMQLGVNGFYLQGSWFIFWEVCCAISRKVLNGSWWDVLFKVLALLGLMWRRFQLCETNTVARKWRELPCDRTIKRLYLVLESCKE